MPSLIRKIQTRGYWQVTVRPTNFREKRVQDIASLYPILRKASVTLRGWDFPHLDPHKDPNIDTDWIGQANEWQHHLSVWRFYQSGQFMHVSGMPIDWRDQSSIWPAPKDWATGTLLGVGDAISCFTEFFEFAARLSQTEAGDDPMQVDITVGNLKGRRLYVDSGNRAPFFHFREASIDNFPQSVQLPRAELLSTSRNLALVAANELFKRFNWETTIAQLRDWQDEMIHK